MRGGGGRGGGGSRGGGGGGGRAGGSRSGSGRIGGTSGRAGGGPVSRPSMSGRPSSSSSGVFGGTPRRFTHTQVSTRRPGTGRGGRSGGSKGSGCATFIVLGVVALVFLIVIISLFSGDSQVTRSTVRREALPSGAAMDSGPWYTDHLGWIGNQTQLLSGLRNFHGKTGVRPHLYLTGEIDGSDAVPTLARLESFANQTYSELFNDEAHLLLVFFENEDAEYAMYAMPGNMARSVMDDEARDILMDYIQRFYYSSSLSEEEMFSRAFDETGERIMTVTRSPWIPVLIVLLVGAAVIAGLLIGLNWWKKAKAQKNLEAEQTERILGQSLEEFGSSGDAASELAKQYSDPPSPPGDIIPVFKSSAQRIVAIRKEGGSIAAYRLAGGRILNKQDAVEFAKLGEIADVCISHRDGAEFLKALPDGTDRNNLSSLPEF